MRQAKNILPITQAECSLVKEPAKHAPAIAKPEA